MQNGRLCIICLAGCSRLIAGDEPWQRDTPAAGDDGATGIRNEHATVITSDNSYKITDCCWSTNGRSLIVGVASMLTKAKSLPLNVTELLKSVVTG